VGLHTLVDSLPGGLYEKITPDGGNLSGGEQQRLALVRALYRNPALLILDEATSSLDPVSEIHVNRLLLGLKARSQTILLITHKKSYASMADRLYVMEQGRIRPGIPVNVDRPGFSPDLRSMEHLPGSGPSPGRVSPLR
jgi:ATP-binding cassette subfamily B protein